MNTFNMLLSNFERLQKGISEACQQSGRAIDEIKLVTVTKNCDISKIQQVYNLGYRDFGESRLQDALPKIAAMPEDCRWHFIGRIQSNKIAKIIENFHLIHSVADYQTACAISTVAEKLKKQPSILLQINTSQELSKAGDSIDTWRQHRQVFSLQNLTICGLMTMAPLSEDSKKIRETFSKLTQFLHELQTLYPENREFKELSMGMSKDYKLAIEEGATIIRIGSALV